MAFDKAHLLMLGVLLLVSIMELSDAQNNKNGLVIIVGAGVSGARAALELKRAGRNFLILEAKDRVGGRLLSLPLGADLKVEMGANWIHDYGSAHQLEKYVTRKNLLSLTDTDFADRVHVKKRGVRIKLSKVRKERRKFGRNYKKAIASKPRNLDVTVSVALHRFSNWKARSPLQCALLSYTIDYEHGLSAEKVSRFQVYEDIEDGPPSSDQFVKYKGGSDDVGYATLVHELLRDSGVDPITSGSKLRLNTPVEQIEYTGTSGVKLTLKGGETLMADAVICTVSVGVLKRAVSTTDTHTYPKELSFDPPLPASKLAAISKLRMGYYTKYYLRFKRPILSASDALLFLPSYDCKLKANVFNLNKGSFYPGSNALLVTLMSKTSEQYSRKSTRTVLRKVLRIVRNVSGEKVRISDVVDSKVLFWNNEAYFRGAYSDHDVGFERSTLNELEKSIGDGRVFLAGETMGYNDYGTVTSAWTSGRKAAKKLLAETSMTK